MRHWNGKILGALIGLFILGPIGAILGLALGHCLDIGLFDAFLNKRGWHRPGTQQSGEHAQQVFFNASFSVMGYVAKSDGRVTEREIDAARQVMSQMGLTGNAREAAIQQFYAGKRPDFDLTGTLQQLRQTCWRHPSLLRTFIEIQLYMANAEGHVTPEKNRAIRHICAQLGLQGFNFNQYQEQARAEQNYQRHYQQHSGARQQYSSQHQLRDAFQILGVNESASASETKKAYRRLMSKHHPDKLIAKGLPPEMVKVATQKTQQIKKAYEAIKQAKGW